MSSRAHPLAFQSTGGARMERRLSKSIDRQNVVRSCWIGTGAEEKGGVRPIFSNQARELASVLATVDPKSHGKTRYKSFSTLKQPNALSVSGLQCNGAAAISYYYQHSLWGRRWHWRAVLLLACNLVTQSFRIVVVHCWMRVIHFFGEREQR